MSNELSPEIELADLEYLVLKLETPAVYSRLAVFIRDPKNREQYWFRKFKVKPGMTMQGNNQLEYIDIEQYDLGEFNRETYKEEDLLNRVKDMIRYESQIAVSKNTVLREMRAVVGIAKYDGPKEYSLDDIVTLVGMKYQQMKSPNRN